MWVIRVKYLFLLSDLLEFLISNQIIIFTPTYDFCLKNLSISLNTRTFFNMAPLLVTPGSTSGSQDSSYKRDSKIYLIVVYNCNYTFPLNIPTNTLFGRTTTWTLLKHPVFNFLFISPRFPFLVPPVLVYKCLNWFLCLSELLKYFTSDVLGFPGGRTIDRSSTEDLNFSKKKRNPESV